MAVCNNSQKRLIALVDVNNPHWLEVAPYGSTVEKTALLE